MGGRLGHTGKCGRQVLARQRQAEPSPFAAAVATGGRGRQGGGPSPRTLAPPLLEMSASAPLPLSFCQPLRSIHREFRGGGSSSDSSSDSGAYALSVGEWVGRGGVGWGGGLAGFCLVADFASGLGQPGLAKQCSRAYSAHAAGSPRCKLDSCLLSCLRQLLRKRPHRGSSGSGLHDE